MLAFPELVLANLAVMLAALLQVTSGIGFAMVVVPLLGLIDLGWVPGPVLQANILLSLAMVARDRGALVSAEAPPLLGGLALGTLLGAGFLTVVPQSALGPVIGLIICLAVTVSLFTPRVRMSKRAIMVGSTAGGITGIVAAMHGPPLILLYQRERPEKVRATMASVFVVGCIMAIATLWLSGHYGQRELIAGFALIPGLGFGYIAGRWVAGRITPAMARGIMLTVSGLGGLALIVRAL